jgi:hypothetical protein
VTVGWFFETSLSALNWSRVGIVVVVVVVVVVVFAVVVIVVVVVVVVLVIVVVVDVVVVVEAFLSEMTWAGGGFFGSTIISGGLCGALTVVSGIVVVLTVDVFGVVVTRGCVFGAENGEKTLGSERAGSGLFCVTIAGRGAFGAVTAGLNGFVDLIDGGGDFGENGAKAPVFVILGKVFSFMKTDGGLLGGVLSGVLVGFCGILIETTCDGGGDFCGALTVEGLLFIAENGANTGGPVGAVCGLFGVTITGPGVGLMSGCGAFCIRLGCGSTKGWETFLLTFITS